MNIKMFKYTGRVLPITAFQEDPETHPYYEEAEFYDTYLPNARAAAEQWYYNTVTKLRQEGRYFLSLPQSGKNIEKGLGLCDVAITLVTVLEDDFEMGLDIMGTLTFEQQVEANEYETPILNWYMRWENHFKKTT